MKNKRISVCLASYNGEAFIEEQLYSILVQLDRDDEVVIYDDGSQDLTCELIRNLSDYRIRLFEGKNVGHVKNFERALRKCQGEFVFLSDQDDVWDAGKVQMTLRAFSENVNICMVHHGFSVIDENGRRQGVVREVAGGVRAGFIDLAKELMKPTIFGSCLALRKDCFGKLLPFPKVTYAHDHWVGILGLLTGGIMNINEPLICRRIHSANVTPTKGQSWSKKIFSRLKFFWLLAAGLARSPDFWRKIRKSKTGNINQ